MNNVDPALRSNYSLRRNKMGKSIQKKWFGKATVPGSQIVVSGVKFADGTTATNDFIIKQTGSNAYVVQDAAQTHAPETVFMVNATNVGGLNPGECFILATPFGGSARPCKKISQYRLSLYEADGTIGSYSWSTVLASAPGQADLITGPGVSGAVLTLAINTAGFGYFTAPAVTLTGGGNGGSAHTTVSNGAVATIVIDSAGTGYSGVTIDAPTAAVTATAHGTATAGVVDTTVTVDVGGGYYAVAPAVTVVGGDGTATAHAVISGGHVTSIVMDTRGTTGYVTPVAFTIAAPPASVQATATGTFSV